MNTALAYENRVDSLPVGFSMIDREGNIRELNRAAEYITGHRKKNVLGKFHLQILHGTVNSEACPLFRRILKSQKRVVAAETSIKAKTGVIMTDIPAIDRFNVVLVDSTIR